MLLPFTETGAFCIYWNIFKVYEAVGHGLGTVNYWTALGVDITISCVISTFALAFWNAKIYSSRMSLYSKNN